MSYTAPTLKKLFALSGNVCAFPGCTAPIIDDETGIVVGEVCHIKGKSKNGPRYDENQTEAERNSYENLLVMCDPHNKIVDHETTRDKYTVEVLRKMKEEHEAPFKRRLTDPRDPRAFDFTLVDQLLMSHFVEHFRNAGSPITTHNQSGGQNAHQVINYREAAKTPQPRLEPVVDIRRAPSQHPKVDIYNFHIKLRNEGDAAAHDFTLEVEIPNAYANPAFSSIARVVSHDRGCCALPLSSGTSC